jgi:trk system potassium uptake protein TrkH
VSVLGIAILLTAHGVYPDFFTALRHAAFNVVSLATTTGFVTKDYTRWPVFAPIWMLFLSCILCSTGSIGGGIKMFRTLVLSRQALRELRLLVHPSAVSPVRVGGKPVPDRVAASILAFIFLYFMTVAALTFALLLTGLDFDSSFGAIIACINNAGPGLGVVGPFKTYQSLTDLQTWICTIAMLLGRLEIFSVLVLFTPTFWRK